LLPEVLVEVVAEQLRLTDLLKDLPLAFVYCGNHLLGKQVEVDNLSR